MSFFYWNFNTESYILIYITSESLKSLNRLEGMITKQMYGLWVLQHWNWHMDMHHMQNIHQ